MARRRDALVRFMPVPEASVHEYHDPVLAEHNVRRARQSPHVLTIAVAPAPQVAAHDEFRLRVLAVDFRHDGGTLFLVPDIHATKIRFFRRFTFSLLLILTGFDMMGKR